MGISEQIQIPVIRGTSYSTRNATMRQQISSFPTNLYRQQLPCREPRNPERPQLPSSWHFSL